MRVNVATMSCAKPRGGPMSIVGISGGEGQLANLSASIRVSSAASIETCYPMSLESAYDASAHNAARVSGSSNVLG